MKIYEGSRDTNCNVVKVSDARFGDAYALYNPINIAPFSLMFSWGTDGTSSPKKQLAFALLLEEFDPQVAKRWYNMLAKEVVAHLEDSWVLTSNDLQLWLYLERRALPV